MTRTEKIKIDLVHRLIDGAIADLIVAPMRLGSAIGALMEARDTIEQLTPTKPEA
jgi:hypothetical protein